MATEGDFTWGGKYNTIYDDVLQNCILESLCNFVNQSQPNKFNFEKLAKTSRNLSSMTCQVELSDMDDTAPCQRGRLGCHAEE